MSGLFDDDDPRPPRRPTATTGRPQRSRILIGTAVVLVVAFFLMSTFTSVWTDRLWFASLGYSSVFSKVLGTRILLFVVFAVLMAAFVGTNMLLAYRHRPAFRPSSPEQAGLDRYRDVVEPARKWLMIGVCVVLGLFAGTSGAGQWRQFLLWRNGGDFGTKDPYFKRDMGWFVFDLPWLHYLVNFAMTAVVLGLVAAAVVHYLFGGIRLQSRGEKLSGAAQVQLSVLLGLFVLIKAFDYWLDRFDLTIEQGRRFTGVNYTAFHAVLPSKNILMFIALICAVLFFANVLRRTWMLPAVGLALLILSAILLGALWPGIVWQFQVRPSEPDKEARFLSQNITATRAAFDVSDVTEQSYPAAVTVTEEQVQASALSLPGIRLIDPARMSQAFEQLQQVRGYYSVAQVLDVDRYPVNGRSRDMVLGVRELDQSGLVTEQRNWANEHTVYTHGYGVVAAYGNQRDADNRPRNNDGEPIWAEEDLPPEGVLTDLTPDGYQPRIYFGEKSPSYSIVGKPPGRPDVELDIPERASAKEGNNTYEGEDGVAIGGLFNKALYALKFGEPNILLSSRVNEESKILYERHPRDRVQKVAPWLTVDGDPYPAVVDGRVVWILDGYTLTDRYPNAERRSLSDMTSDALAPTTSYVTLPTDEINYMRNSVKAVVDAYDGTVELYAWDSDPILAAWSKAFPGVVKPKTDIPDALMAHLRYPEDLFKVQRNILAQYHVTRPQDFYKGTDRWEVPQDPAQEANKQPPYRLSVQMPPEKEGEGQPTPVFSLTSVYVPTNRSNLASFIAADSDATSDDYGRIRILRLPDSTQIQGPSQIANTFAADDRIQDALLGIKQNSQILYGNLLTLPIGGGLLYVQPVYALQQSGEGSYPVLRFVLASFGRNAGYGSTLGSALCDALGGTDCEAADDGSLLPTGTGSTPGTGGNGSGGNGNGGSTTGTPAGVLLLLRQADAKFAEAEQALRNGDFAAYGQATADAQRLLERAITAAERQNRAATPPTTQQKGGGSGG